MLSPYAVSDCLVSPTKKELRMATEMGRETLESFVHAASRIIEVASNNSSAVVPTAEGKQQ